VRGPTRPLAVVLVTLLVAGLGVPSLVLAAGEDKPGPCGDLRTEDQTVRQWVKEVIRCAERRWEVPGGAQKAICVADAESGLNPKAVSETGEYVGLFQHSAQAWPDRYREWTRQVWELDERPLNGRTNTIVTIRMVNASGWGPWAGVGDC
jgi:hypothetical protein